MMQGLVIDDYDALENFARKAFSRHFARRLVDAMYEKRMNQNELAEKTRISKGTISVYISGKGNPLAYNVYKLSIALDKPIDYFY